MSIRNRLEDAILLWEHGRKEGAWIHVLIAAAATSRLRYPKPPPNPKGAKKKKGAKAKTFHQDREAFTAFIRDITPTIIDPSQPAIVGGVNVILRADTANQLPLADAIYTHLRCHLMHQAEMHNDIRLSPSRIENGVMIADFKGGSPLVLPDCWALHLAIAVQEAPENAALFAGKPVFHFTLPSK